jgi:hypothetical protein
MQFVYFEKEVERHFHLILRRFLEKHDMLYLRDVLITILKELVANATKANAKRLYFQNKGLDITVKHDYIEGMNTFKTDVLHTDSEVLHQLG